MQAWTWLDADGTWEMARSDATNGFEQDMGAFMLLGLELPAGGCWELVGRYHGRSLRLVVWVLRWQP